MKETLPLKAIEALIQEVPDFPKPGINFKDITPILDQPEAFRSLITHFKETIPEPIDKVIAIESRGFLLGAPLALTLSAGLVLVRKPGKLPRPTVKKVYSLEYGEDALEIQKEDLAPGDRVLIIDDVLATGGTAAATEDLCDQLGAKVVGSRFLIELAFLGGSSKLKAPCQSLLSYS